MKDDKYYTTMGQVLFEKTKPTLETNDQDSFKDRIAKKAKRQQLEFLMKNEFALAEMAKRYEENVKNSDDPELLFQLENIIIEVRGRLGLDD